MDTEYLADLVAGRVRDYILYDARGNHNVEAIVRGRYAALRARLKQMVPLDELEAAPDELHYTRGIGAGTTHVRVKK